MVPPLQWDVFSERLINAPLFLAGLPFKYSKKIPIIAFDDFHTLNKLGDWPDAQPRRRSCWLNHQGTELPKILAQTS